MFKDENGKFYYGWIIVLVAGLVTGFVYNGIASVTGIFMLPVTTDLGISVGGFSLYFTIMSFVSMFVLMFFSKYFTEKSIKKMMAIGGILTIISLLGFLLQVHYGCFSICSAAGRGFCDYDNDSMSGSGEQLVWRKIKRKSNNSISCDISINVYSTG